MYMTETLTEQMYYGLFIIPLSVVRISSIKKLRCCLPTGSEKSNTYYYPKPTFTGGAVHKEAWIAEAADDFLMLAGTLQAVTDYLSAGCEL